MPLKKYTRKGRTRRNKVGSGKYKCPICNHSFSRRSTVRDPHFAICVRAHGNPKNLPWDADPSCWHRSDKPSGSYAHGAERANQEYNKDWAGNGNADTNVDLTKDDIDDHNKSQRDKKSTMPLVSDVLRIKKGEKCDSEEMQYMMSGALPDEDVVYNGVEDDIEEDGTVIYKWQRPTPRRGTRRRRRSETPALDADPRARHGKRSRTKQNGPYYTQDGAGLGSSDNDNNGNEDVEDPDFEMLPSIILGKQKRKRQAKKVPEKASESQKCKTYKFMPVKTVPQMNVAGAQNFNRVQFASHSGYLPSNQKEPLYVSPYPSAESQMASFRSQSLGQGTAAPITQTMSYYPDINIDPTLQASGMAVLDLSQDPFIGPEGNIPVQNGFVFYNSDNIDPSLDATPIGQDPGHSALAFPSTFPMEGQSFGQGQLAPESISPMPAQGFGGSPLVPVQNTEIFPGGYLYPGCEYSIDELLSIPVDFNEFNMENSQQILQNNVSGGANQFPDGGSVGNDGGDLGATSATHIRGGASSAHSQSSLGVEVFTQTLGSNPDKVLDEYSKKSAEKIARAKQDRILGESIRKLLQNDQSGTGGQEGELSNETRVVEAVRGALRMPPTPRHLADRQSRGSNRSDMPSPPNDARIGGTNDFVPHHRHSNYEARRRAKYRRAGRFGPISWDDLETHLVPTLHGPGKYAYGDAQPLANGDIRPIRPNRPLVHSGKSPIIDRPGSEVSSSGSSSDGDEEVDWTAVRRHKEEAQRVKRDKDWPKEALVQGALSGFKDAMERFLNGDDRAIERFMRVSNKKIMAAIDIIREMGLNIASNDSNSQATSVMGPEIAMGGTEYGETADSADRNEVTSGIDHEVAIGGAEHEETADGADHNDTAGGTDPEEADSGTDYDEAAVDADHREASGVTDREEAGDNNDHNEVTSGTDPDETESEANSGEAADNGEGEEDARDNSSEDGEGETEDEEMHIVEAAPTPVRVSEETAKAIADVAIAVSATKAGESFYNARDAWLLWYDWAPHEMTFNYRMPTQGDDPNEHRVSVASMGQQVFEELWKLSTTFEFQLDLLKLLLEIIEMWGAVDDYAEYQRLVVAEMGMEGLQMVLARAKRILPHD